MMGFRQWLLCISVCAILVGTVRYLLPQGRSGAVVQFVSGLLLLVCVLKPLGDVKLDALLPPDGWEEKRGEQKDALQASYEEMLQTSIAERTGAYIEDKASTLGLTAHAAVFPEGNGELSVSLDIERSAALERYMEEELGIARQRQKWRDGN